MVSKEHVEIVNNYIYLGVKFSANGNFTITRKTSQQKQRGPLFAARRYLDVLKITNSHHQQTVQYTIFSNFNVLLRSLGNL